MLPSSLVLHFIAIGEFKLELQSVNPQIGTKFVLTSVTLTFDIWHWPFVWTSLFVNGNSSWKFHDEPNIVEKVSQADGETDGKTDRQTGGRWTEVFLQLVVAKTSSDIWLHWLYPISVTNGVFSRSAWVINSYQVAPNLSVTWHHSYLYV